MKRSLSIVLCIMLASVLVLAACGKNESKPSESAATSGASASQGESKEIKPIVVGVSNGYIGNGWRTQMTEAIEQLAEDYKQKGWIEKIIVQHAGVDVNNQIAQIRNMINAKVDLLLIDPNSETALNPVIEEAVKKGITVITFDQPVTTPKSINVVIDQQEFGRNLAEWFVNELDGKGDIVIVSGLAGSSANVNRLIGMKEVLAKHPDIKVLTEVNGNWDEANAQQVTSNLIASYPKIDGVLTQDGMALGVVNAFQAANKKLPVITGENNVAFLKKWKELKDSEGFSTYGQNNPPGIGATALGIGVRMLQGKKSNLPMKDNTFYYPISTHIKNDTLEAELNKVADKPDTFTLDEWLSEEQLNAFFE
ncbi:ABC transporter substrate-binding protein [Cohnella cholangitidis]|uniref:ABC transporter substrate-binding protein n=1 Tax=Cohnella cholangitidis TaxID=2598458 RepID=A0A7G5C278_9BACL|nr:ABC transporter substrate-binding protein [Cohnella cholangitidis]QMV43312.1 ABC transporter substrate-binding protein [Cohnella cholangitidis]